MKTIFGGIILTSLVLLGAQGGMGPGPGTPHSSGGGSCALPFTDNFTGGTGALGPCWTSPVSGAYSGWSGTVTQTGGTATSTGQGFATVGSTLYSGVTVQVVSTSGVAAYSGPAALGAGGNGYVWLIEARGIYYQSGGSASAVSGIICPNVNAGDTVSMKVSGSSGAWTLLCTDITTTLFASGVDTNTFTSFYPAMFVSGGTLSSYYATSP